MSKHPMPRLRYVVDPTTEPTPGAPAQPAPTTPPAPAEADEPLGKGGIKALQAERDARAAAERALADLRKQVEDSKKTAEQKAADDLKAAQQAAAEAAARALRYEVAAAKGLDLNLATRLAGSTKEELEADADALMALIPKTEQHPQRPTGDPVPTVGQAPGTPSGNVSLKDQIAAAEKAGNRELVASLKAMQLTTT